MTYYQIFGFSKTADAGSAQRPMDLCDSDSSDSDALVDDGSTGAAAAVAGGTAKDTAAPVSCSCVRVNVF